jgi:hypothetical protein
MRRFILLLTVAAMLAVVMVAMAAPAFAGGNDCVSTPVGFNCSGGSGLGHGEGGSGGHEFKATNPVAPLEVSGGRGHGAIDPGGGGLRCVGDPILENCVGTNTPHPPESPGF